MQITYKLNRIMKVSWITWTFLMIIKHLTGWTDKYSISLYIFQWWGVPHGEYNTIVHWMMRYFKCLNLMNQKNSSKYHCDYVVFIVRKKLVILKTANYLKLFHYRKAISWFIGTTTFRISFFNWSGHIGYHWISSKSLALYLALLLHNKLVYYKSIRLNSYV